ncbi:MAG: hypothetical protein M3N95_11900 [Actinomycetota bacterium]|nr:hypothetical protein [Actinomycetota bacterium]
MEHLKYAHVERERRYLVREVPSGVDQVEDILDAYIMGTRLRLRTITRGDAVIQKLGHKVRLGPGPREIASTSLYLNETEWAVLSALPVRYLHKRRHQLTRDGYSFAIDEFDDGSLLAEFDDGLGEQLPVPAWLKVIADVTDDEQWTGAGRAAAVGT